MSSGKVFVAGSLHYDIVVDAPKLPAIDETVMGGSMQFVCGGKGGNQAVAASLHGADVCFGGIVGRDRFGDALLENLHKSGVDCGQITRTDEAVSGASVAIVEDAGGYGAVVASGANRLADADHMAIVEGTKLLVLQNEIPEQTNFDLAKLARSTGIKVVLNAAPWRSFETELRSFVDILVVNRVEAVGLIGIEVGSVDQALSALRKLPPFVGCIIITLGEEGLVFVMEGNQPEFIPPFKVPVVSSHGAGDTFVGALCAQLLCSRSMRDALTYASAAAALLVSTPVETRTSIDRDQTLALMASAHLRA